jgi:uncharacterized protein (TIGR02145 family)
MKKFYAILCLAIASLTQLQAQAPQGFNYQATVRNSTGDLVVNTNVYFKFNVIQGSNTAVPIFTETHYVPTDDLGQVNLVIGQGTANSGSFSALDWSLGSYYLGIELDTGSGYLAMGTTQLLSVPYALYAENSGNATSATPNLQSVLAENNSAGQQQIKDLLDPTDAQDAVTKNYADNIISSFGYQQWSNNQVWNDNTTISPEPNSFWFINADNTTIALPPLSNQGDVIKIYYMGAGFNNTPENSNYSEGFYTNIDAQTNEVFIGYFGIIEPYDEGFHYTFNEIIPFTLARGLNTFIQIGDYWMLGEAVPLPPQYIDNDGDGFSETEGDCDDTNASVNPGATEIEDGIDNDCDGQIDEGFELCTLETAESYSASNLNMTFQTDPSEDFISDGAGFSWIDNPDYDNTINSSCKVGQVVKGNNNPWDNNQYDLDAKLDFNVNSGLKIKVWSARPNTEVRIKLEEIGNAGNSNEQFLTTSVTSGWEELTFPFTAAESGKFDKIVLFFDLNTTSTATYYFDDLKLYGNGGNGGGGGGTVTDQNGNSYNYLSYGNQAWTVENAEMVTYRDGTPIPEVTDNTEWENLTTGAWAYYNNDPTKGKLYNWYAVMGIHDTDPNTPNKEFAPEGWHVPTDAEWTTLEEYLIASGYNYDGTTTENKIAKAMASTTGWSSSTGTGTPGNDQSLNNDSGFNAFPEGYLNGSFGNEGFNAIFWSSTEYFPDDAWFRNLLINSSYLYRGNVYKHLGFSVRFVRD